VHVAGLQPEGGDGGAPCLSCSLEFRTRELMDAESFVESRGNFTFCKYFEAA
jgi:hypothetical protein